MTTVTRDSLGRVTSVTPAIAGTSGTSYGYVAGRKDNLLAYMTDPSGSTSWTYDSAGRLLSKSQNTGGITRGITLTRDSVGRVTRMVYPSGMALDYTYNGDLVTSIVAAGYPLMSNITYRPFSNVATGWTWGNGSTYSRSFDADGRITQVTLGDRTRSYAFDPVGRISGFTDSGSAGTQSSSFSYDEAGQLTAYSGPQGNYSYGYDTNGNRRSISANGSAGSYTFAAGTNRILTSPNGNFSYFAGGQPSSDGYYSFVYDGYNRLKQMTSADYRVVRSYNGQGQRVNSTVSQFTSPTALASPSIAAGQGKGAPVKAPNDGALAAKQLQAKGGVVNALPGGQWITVSARHFFHDDAGRLLGEYPAAGSTDPAQETVWFNGQPVGALINGVGYFVYADHLVTPRTLVRISDNVVAWQWHSEPFGNTYPTSSIGIAYNPRFPGQQFDADTGYHYNWMRDYYPANGRYLQADPIGLAGGLSRFGYVGGNPLSNSDLSGLLYVAVRVEFSDRFAVFHREDGPAFPMPTFVGFFTIQDAPCYFLCYFSDKKWNEGTENGKDMSSCQRKS